MGKDKLVTRWHVLEFVRVYQPVTLREVAYFCHGNAMYQYQMLKNLVGFDFLLQRRAQSMWSKKKKVWVFTLGPKSKWYLEHHGLNSFLDSHPRLDKLMPFYEQYRTEQVKITRKGDRIVIPAKQFVRYI